MKRIVVGSMVVVLLAMLLAGCSGCSGNKAKQDGDSLVDSADRADRSSAILSGKLSIIVDEATLPMMERQIEVFKTSYVNTAIEVIALPEREAINALLEGRGNIAVLARLLSEEESAGFKNRGVKPRTFPIYHDGVVFFNNVSAPDTTMDVSTVTSLLDGKGGDRMLVFDNINSSTFRLVKELTGVERVSGQSVKGMKNSKEVFEEVLSNSRSIGVVSYAQYLEFRELFGDENKIRILSLQTLKEGVSEGYFKPSQTTFATDEYALASSFYVLNYQPNLGLGTGLSAFLTSDRGQRIALRYGLLPATMPGREIIIREDNIK